MTSKIGEPSRSIVGRTSAWKRARRGVKGRASWDRRCGLLVEEQRLAALRSRRTLGCVSRMTTRAAVPMAPPRMASSQKVQRQPFSAATKPPMTGPRTWRRMCQW